MRRELVNPKMLAHLARFYPDTCTIKYYTSENRDSYGQPQPVWIDFPGHVNLSCSIAAKGGMEAKRPDMILAIGTHTIALAGYRPDIVPKMRAIVKGQVYDILVAEVDSHGKMTRLTVEVVT